MARGTSQACSYRSQELYFQQSQKLKETMRDYEDAQGLLYQEQPVHLDSDLVGPMLATFVHLQRKLRTAREEKQAAWDQRVNADVLRREAERQVTQLKRELSGTQDIAREAQETAREPEKNYHETQVLLRRAQNATPAVDDPADRVCIQSLEKQLRDADQQLRRLREERALNAADGQIAVNQDQVNEWLEALQIENKELHRNFAQMVVERDHARKEHVNLQMQTLRERAQWDTASNTLEVRCLQAEAEVVELREKVATLERRGAYSVSPSTASVTLGPYSHSVSSGAGSGLAAQASPQLGGGLGGLSMPQVPTPPSVGQIRTAHVLARLRAMDTEGAPQAPEASVVSTGAPSTTTNQGPTQAGSHPAPQ